MPTPLSFNSRQSIIGMYLILVAVWSTTPLMVVLSLRELDALWALTLRFVIASIILLLIVNVLRLGLPFSRVALKVYAIGGLGLFWTMLLTYLGAKTVSSGLISVIYGLSPLFAGFIGHVVLKSERLNYWQWLGIAVAIAGLLLIFGTSHVQQRMLLGLIYVLLAVIGYVISIYWLRAQNSQLHPMVQTTGSMLLATAALLMMIPWIWTAHPRFIPGTLTVMVILYSAVFSSVIAMTCYFALITRVKPSTLALATIIPPVVACMLGMLFNDEVITLRLFMGIAIVIGGLLLYFVPRQKQMATVTNDSMIS